jgi:hypothetical protein
MNRYIMSKPEEKLWDFLTGIGDSIRINSPFLWADESEYDLHLTEPNALIDFLRSRWKEKFSATPSDAILQRVVNMLNGLGFCEIEDNYYSWVSNMVVSAGFTSTDLTPQKDPSQFLQPLLVAAKANIFVYADSVQVFHSGLNCFSIRDQLFHDFITTRHEELFGTRPSKSAVSTAIKLFEDAVARGFETDSWAARVNQLRFIVFSSGPSDSICQARIIRD